MRAGGCKRGTIAQSTKPNQTGLGNISNFNKDGHESCCFSFSGRGPKMYWFNLHMLWKKKPSVAQLCPRCQSILYLSVIYVAWEIQDWFPVKHFLSSVQQCNSYIICASACEARTMYPAWTDWCWVKEEQACLSSTTCPYLPSKPQHISLINFNHRNFLPDDWTRGLHIEWSGPACRSKLFCIYTKTILG